MLLILIVITISRFGNASGLNPELVELAKIYRNFMFRNNPQMMPMNNYPTSNRKRLQQLGYL
jgi:hypothetical protein